MAGLTAKQENACLKYLECGDKSEAYRFAYSTSKMKDKTIHEAACRLFADSKVAARMAELRAGVEKRTEITVDGVLAQLVEDREFAKSLDNPSSAVRVDELLGKHLGMFVDKSEVDVTLRGPLVIMRSKKDKEVEMSEKGPIEEAMEESISRSDDPASLHG